METQSEVLAKCHHDESLIDRSNHRGVAGSASGTDAALGVEPTKFFDEPCGLAPNPFDRADLCLRRITQQDHDTPIVGEHESHRRL